MPDISRTNYSYIKGDLAAEKGVIFLEMGSRIFKGGVHPEYHKELTASLAITPLAPPQQVVIPLQQHIGAPCEPMVAVGDRVLLGQKIGDGKAFVSAPVHASVSGTVRAIGPYNHPLGRKAEAITIESDGQESPDPSIRPAAPLEELTAGQIRELVRQAGIVGMGGAAFPAHVKLAPPADKPIDTVILNGAECEPYLTADHRVMLESPREVVFGLLAIMKALGAEKGIIGIESNKPDALRVMSQALAERDAAEIRVVPLQTKYPQGAEKMLIRAATGRKVPAGGLPMDVGVVNHNVATALAIARALKQGRPLIERVVTVTGGGVARTANLLVRVGTLVSDLLEACGGLKESARKLVVGGPMMGLAQPNANLPVIKGTSGILVLDEEEASLEAPQPCIKCARCVGACPMNLLPLFLAQLAEYGLIERAEKLHAADCFECGCCSYICPTRRPLTEWIRIAKSEILARRAQKQK